MDSASPQLAAFELHLRELELPESPPDTADFAGPLLNEMNGMDGTDSLAGELDQLLLDSAALTEGFVRLPGAPGVRVIPLFDASSWPIPIPEPELVAELQDEARPDPELAAPWELKESRPAIVALIPQADPLRTAIAAAITLPPLLTATPALASAEPEVQRPRASPASQPEAVEPAAPTQPAAVEPASPTPPPEVAETTPSEPAPPEPTPPESIISPEPAAEFEVDPTPAPSTQGVPETLWQAMKDNDVKLMLPSGSRRGRLAAVDGPEVVFIDAESGGRLYSIPKAQVMELRGIVNNNNGGRANGRPYGVPDPNLPSGTGFLAGGIIATSIGTPFLLSAAGVGLACGASCTSITLPLLVPAVLGLGAGIPMMVVGVRRKKAWNRSKIETARLSPSFGRTRHGSWTGSVSLRF